VADFNFSFQLRNVPLFPGSFRNRLEYRFDGFIGCGTFREAHQLTEEHDERGGDGIVDQLISIEFSDIGILRSKNIIIKNDEKQRDDDGNDFRNFYDQRRIIGNFRILPVSVGPF